jgi:hypothetical protein
VHALASHHRFNDGHNNSGIFIIADPAPELEGGSVLNVTVAVVEVWFERFREAGAIVHVVPTITICEHASATVLLRLVKGEIVKTLVPACPAVIVRESTSGVIEKSGKTIFRKICELALV